MTVTAIDCWVNVNLAALGRPGVLEKYLFENAEGVFFGAKSAWSAGLESEDR